MAKRWPAIFKRKWFWACVAVLAPLYAFTWIGGWMTYARELHNRTESGWRAMRSEDDAEEAADLRAGVKPHRPSVHPNGPRSGVNWCVPILPGVLLADSYESIGPLYGEGGVYVVLYHGFGCTRICMLYGWLA